MLAGVVHCTKRTMVPQPQLPCVSGVNLTALLWHRKVLPSQTIFDMARTVSLL